MTISTAKGLGEGAPVVLVTGAATGIGLTMAHRLVGLGYRVVAVDIDAETLASSFGECDSAQILGIVANIADEEQAAGCVQKGVAHFGRLDGLVNNAALHGKYWNRPSLDYSLAQWQEIFAVNVFAVALLAGAARSALADSRGVIVNISSMDGYGHSHSCPYAVSKVAMNGMTMNLAKELGTDGIRVVGLAPGFIGTPAILSFLGQADQDRIEALQSVKGQGTPDDVADMVAFLLSPQSRLVTGTTIHADLGIIHRL